MFLTLLSVRKLCKLFTIFAASASLSLLLAWKNVRLCSEPLRQLLREVTPRPSSCLGVIEGGNSPRPSSCLGVIEGGNSSVRFMRPSSCLGVDCAILVESVSGTAWCISPRDGPLLRTFIPSRHKLVIETGHSMHLRSSFLMN